MTCLLFKYGFNDLISRRIVVWCAATFFALTLAIGLFHYRDYGISFDEPVSRDNGAISLKYAIHKLNLNLFIDDRELKKVNVLLNDYRDRDYGVVFDLPAFVLERALGIDDTREQFLFRHLLTFLLFWCSSIAFYFFLQNSFNSHIYALIGTVMLFLSPRIFADAFYNSKDITLMSIGIVCSLTMYFFLKNPSYLLALLHGFVCALLIDTRIVGLIFPAVTVALFILIILATTDKRLIAILITFAFSLVVFVYVFWPWLWEAPVSNLRIAFSNMANFRWPNYNLYWGEYISALDLPWHYALTWIVLTTPPLYILMTATGILVTVRRFRLQGRDDIFQSQQIPSLTAFLIITGTLAPIILLKSTLYDGWRQLYFIYPSMLVLAIYGLKVGIEFLIKVRAIALIWALSITLTIQFVSLSLWMYAAHPFQNVYFNSLAPNNTTELFEGDYWGLGNLNLLKFIHDNDSRSEIRISSLGATSIMQSLLIFPSNLNPKRFIYVHDPDEADYVITNFRFLSKQDTKNLDPTWWLFHQLKVDDKVIGAIYSH